MSGRATRVLVVEDDDEVRRAISEMLRDAGYAVSEAQDGWRGLQALREGTPADVILLDLYMPVMDGWRFREEQRRDPAIARIPVLAMSARGFHAPPIDADGFLAKPMGLEDLRAAVAKLAGPCDESK